MSQEPVPGPFGDRTPKPDDLFEVTAGHSGVRGSEVTFHAHWRDVVHSPIDTPGPGRMHARSTEGKVYFLSGEIYVVLTPKKTGK